MCEVAEETRLVFGIAQIRSMLRNIIIQNENSFVSLCSGDAFPTIIKALCIAGN